MSIFSILVSASTKGAMPLLHREPGTIIFLKVDVDKLKSVAEEWGVEAMPTFLFLKEGKLVDKVVYFSLSPVIVSFIVGYRDLRFFADLRSSRTKLRDLRPNSQNRLSSRSQKLKIKNFASFIAD